MSTKTSIAFLFASLISLFAAIASAADCPKGMVRVASCNNGKTYCSVSGDHRGACSGAGGVKAWADGSPVKAKGGKRSATF